jgi:hypothetical protein
MDMKNQSGGTIRKAVTRVLATSALLVMYGVGMIATTGAVATATSTSAFAQRGRGRGWGGRGRGRGRGWGGPGVGAAIGLGVGAAVIGGAIAASAAERQNAINYCASRFRSFDPNTMTYIAAGGVRRPCP